MKCLATFLATVLSLWLMAGVRTVDAQKPLQVAVSILPQKYFVEKVGGEWVAVSVMVEPGVDPHVYDPKPQQMVSLGKAQIYFAVGIPFEEAWLERFSATNPRMLMVHTEVGIEKLPMDVHDHDEEHGKNRPSHKTVPQNGPRHDSRDPHLWLSPVNAMIQARNIFHALMNADPEHASTYETNYKNFMKELLELDLELLHSFQGQTGSREFMVFHPAWGYFAAAYGLRQTPVEVEGKEPKAADLQRLIQYAKDHEIKAIFVQPQYSTASAKVLAQAIGAQIIVADPMAEEWAKNLREVAAKFKAALR